LTYQAALNNLYDLFKIERPILFPRISGTFLFNDVDKQVVGHLPAIKLVKSANATDLDLGMRFIELRNTMDKLIKKGISVSDLSQGKMIIDKMLSKVTSKSNPEIEELSNIVFPFGELQERNLSFVATFQSNMNKLGTIKNELNPFKFLHQVIKI
ncbi:MAG: hypothetical protein HY606_06235, partial [Planctomycetes bacterium]|nr:hypothetical protein [Planctomycetota bacterium]